jgi:hypothetical protein
MLRTLGQTLAVLLAALLAAQAPLAAQAKSGLKIMVIDGEGAINNIQLGSGKEPVVEVRDQSDRPVAGAKVTFTLPERGPSGTFFGASRTVTVPANDQGRATATGFRPNLQEGRFQIQVTAAAGESTATTVINQTNALPTGGMNRVSGQKGLGKGKVIGILLAAAAVVGIALAARDDEAATTPTTTPGTTITPGVVSVGNPR